MVLCLAPILPGIFLFLKTLPGSVLLPVDPNTLWDREQPCEAGCILKCHLLMVPWNPFPFVIPVMSTYCPGTK